MSKYKQEAGKFCTICIKNKIISVTLKELKNQFEQIKMPTKNR